MAEPVLCLYVLDENGEATDVLYYCSRACRYDGRAVECRPVSAGTTTDAAPGTVCETCGRLVEPEEANRG